MNNRTPDFEVVEEVRDRIVAHSVGSKPPCCTILPSEFEAISRALTLVLDARVDAIVKRDHYVTVKTPQRT